MKTRRSTSALVRILQRSAILVAGTLVGWGCTGSVDVLKTSDAAPAGDGAGGDGAGGDGNATSTTGATSASTGGQTPVGPPECTSPSGYKVCGGSNHCPFSSDFCPMCLATEKYGDQEEGFVDLCYNDEFKKFHESVPSERIYCGTCIDGHACFAPKPAPSDVSACVPFEFAQLVAANGAPERLRYADHGLWTGAPLPEPADCPTLLGVSLCGGACGGCGDGATCTGRAPLHPYGLCVSDYALDFGECNADRPCDAPGWGCFHWKVEPAAQAQADARGICLPPVTCKAAAASLPGGGYCVEP